MQIKSYGDKIFKISDLIRLRMALFHQICKNLDFEKSLLWVKTTFKMSKNDFKTIQTLFKVVFNSIDIISDHSDHLWVKVERYQPVQVIKNVHWRLYERGYLKTPQRRGYFGFAPHRVTLNYFNRKPRWLQGNFWSLNTMRMLKNHENHFKPL